MVLPSDKEYKETKLIRQKQKQLETPFKEMADWFHSSFGVEVLNVYYDIISKTRPRLNIILEFERDELKYYDPSSGKFDEKTQQHVANKFSEVISNLDIKETGLLKRLMGKTGPKYSAENIFVIFSSFDKIAKIEINQRISDNEIRQLKQSFAIDDLWKIHRQFSSVVFFFYTNDRVNEYEQNNKKEFLAEEYLAVLKKHDEFNYFNKEALSIKLDSKENFDTNYESNWYYYDK